MEKSNCENCCISDNCTWYNTETEEERKKLNDCYDYKAEIGSC